MKRVLLLLVLVWAPAVGQEPASRPDEQIQTVVTVKYIDPEALRNLLANFPIITRVDSRLRVITLSGTRSRVTTAEDAIKQLDVPAAAQKDIELTVYFVAASDQSNPSPGGKPIPPDLQGTVSTLKTTFPFKTYEMLDTLSLRARSGVGAESTGQLSGGRLTTFRVNSASLEADGSMIRLDHLKAGLRIPHSLGEGKGDTYLDTGISTDIVDVKEGQKLVVGRSSLDGPEKAMFLILIAKVVN